MSQKLYEYLEKRRSTLKTERESFDSHYKALSENIQPRRGRFFVQDRNKGDRRHNLIINSAGTQAHRAAVSGIFSGIMSPTRPWFNLGTPDPGLMEYAPVSIWLSQVETIIRKVFNQSNLYNMAPVMLGETLLFGTGCMLHVDDFDDIARFYTQTVGTYYVGQNNRYEVDTLMREYEMQVGAMIQEFGLENVCTAVKDQYDKGNYDSWFPVCHMIEPNRDRSSDNPFNINKPYRSVYYEPGNVNKKILRQSGFKTFPAYVPRWGVTGEDVYGTDCPGMVALGDVKSLQIQEKRKAQAIDKLVNPPLKGPASVRNVPISSLPGGVTLHSGSSAEESLGTLYQVNPQVQHLMMDIDKTERRIGDAFFMDLFLAISNMEGIQPKNQLELSQRNEERLLQLGPVLEQLHGEFLDKLIDRTFEQLVEADVLPPAPPELEGVELKVNYISSLAQAQRAVATGGIERLAGFVGQLAQIQPQVLDKFDGDQAIDEYAAAIHAPPKIVRSDDDVLQERQERQAQQAQQQQLEQMELGSKSIANVAKSLPEDLV